MHFLEIIKPQLFGKAVKYKAMYGVFFQIEALLSPKNSWLPPQFSFWIQKALAKFCFLHIVFNRAKIFMY